MTRPTQFIIAMLATLCGVTSADAGSLRLVLSALDIDASGTLTIGFETCPGTCACASSGASISVSCAGPDADPEALAIAIACKINSELSPTYFARISAAPGEMEDSLRLDLFFPDGECLCIDGQRIDPTTCTNRSKSA